MTLVVFNPFVVLFWIFVTSFIPGAMLALAVLKKYELRLFEKILIGFATGLIIPSLVAFVINLAGVPYSFAIAVASVLIFYLLSIYLFWQKRAYELAVDFKPALGWLIPLVLAVLMFLSFWIRLQSYSPVFSELDPYFYVYSAQQLLTLGNTPFEDKTAWYPEVLNDHRTAPAVSFMEANWYSFYTAGGEYSNYLLAAVANVYPPLVSAFIAFFVYLFVSSHTRRSYGLVSAALVSFMPVFILKLAAGEIETQPYGFFALSMFFALYALAFKYKSRELAAFAALAYGALSLGSASGIVAMASLVLFVPLQGILLFLKNDAEKLRTFLALNIIILAGGVLLTAILKDFYGSGSLISLSSHSLIISVALAAFVAALYFIRTSVKNFEMSVYALAGLLAACILAVAVFAPVGDAVKGIALGGLGVAEYKYALQRTIAEQPPAYSGDFSFHLGAVGDRMQTDYGSPLNALPALGNSLLDLEVRTINALLGTRLEYKNTLYYDGFITDEKTRERKQVTYIHMWLLLFILLLPIASALALLRYIHGEETLFLFFLVTIAPPVIVGFLKAKYIIYLGFLLAISVGFIFGELEPLLARLLKKADFEVIKFDRHTFSFAFLIFMVFGTALPLAELYDEHFPSPIAILSSSMQVRFQDDPVALQDKFRQLCNQIRLAGGGEQYDVCEPGRNPVAYASASINNQYNPTLCILSIMKDPYAYLVKQNAGQLSREEQLELTAASYRCQRINDYWIESMEWIRDNTERGSRITSWWDYGHWINFFGQKNAVLRNDHASTNMIGRVAYSYLHGSLDDLKTTMRDYDSEYVLFDVEIAGANMGGKYHALNYLGCAWSNQTNVSVEPGTSRCEAEHMWENIFVPMQELPGSRCVISNITNKTGVMAFYGLNRDDFGNIVSLGSPAYCIGKAMLADGSETFASFYLDRTYENGDLKLNKADMLQGEVIRDQNNQPMIVSFTLLYTKEPKWLENGEITDGYGDRKGRYYDSNLYRAFFLNDLPGFELVYESSQRSQFGGHVKIYKLAE